MDANVSSPKTFLYFRILESLPLLCHIERSIVNTMFSTFFLNSIHNSTRCKQGNIPPFLLVLNKTLWRDQYSPISKATNLDKGFELCLDFKNVTIVTFLKLHFQNLEIRAPFLKSSNNFFSVFSIYYEIVSELNNSLWWKKKLYTDFVIYRKYREKIIGWFQKWSADFQIFLEIWLDGRYRIKFGCRTPQFYFRLFEISTHWEFLVRIFHVFHKLFACTQ